MCVNSHIYENKEAKRMRNYDTYFVFGVYTNTCIRFKEKRDQDEKKILI